MCSLLDLLYSKSNALLENMSLKANDWALEVHSKRLTAFPYFTKHFSLGYREVCEVLASPYIAFYSEFPKASNSSFTLK